jgi:hypothetical protein
MLLDSMGVCARGHRGYMCSMHTRCLVEGGGGFYRGGWEEGHWCRVDSRCNRWLEALENMTTARYWLRGQLGVTSGDRSLTPVNNRNVQCSVCAELVRSCCPDPQIVRIGQVFTPHLLLPSSPPPPLLLLLLSPQSGVQPSQRDPHHC